MSLRVYNTLTKQKELFQPVRPGKVGMYLCGPTVYKAPHIGHMVGPVIFDAVKRYLKYKGFDVTWVVNITDVDDKLIDAAAKHKTTVTELAERHTKEYFECLALLGVDSIDRFPKASEHIPEIISMCQGLIAGGFAYASEGNVWFDVARDPDYGKLSHRSVEQQESGGRTLEAAGKRSAADFALWKTAKPGEPAWESPWGPGRPGWHIECSAMSTKYLGPTFDIHGGGMDLMFPHHENELAQSESATGQKFVNFWMHNGLTKVRTKAQGGEWKTEDMHESSGNAIRVRELIEQHGSELIRYLLLSTHYRRPIDFSAEVLEASKKGLSVFFRVFERMTRLTGKPLEDVSPDMDVTSGNMLETPHGGFARDVLGLKMKFLEMMDDDFNTAGGIAVMHELAGSINAFIERNDLEKSKQAELLDYATAATQTLRRLGLVLGLFRSPMTATAAQQDQTLDKVMKLMIRLRAEARASKNFALADSIRKGLTEIGVTLEDRAEETLWRKE
ncbi:MAG TPA: cysteine--tRNA ligase [Tepidisphaeraceae bacterium]|jgi:cysteinyl-tRNA synthetase